MMNLIAGLVTLQLMFASMFLYKYFSYTSFWSPWFQSKGVDAPASLSTTSMDPSANRVNARAPLHEAGKSASDKSLSQTTWNNPLGTSHTAEAHVQYASLHAAADKTSLDVFQLCLELVVRTERCPLLQQHVYDVLMYDFADLISTFNLTDYELLSHFLVSAEQQKLFREACVHAVALMDVTDKYDFDKPHGVERASMFISYHLRWFDETANSLAKYKRGVIAYEEMRQRLALFEAEEAAAAATAAAASISTTQQAVKTDL